MSDLRTAAQQALEALKNNAGEMRVEGAISILETALAQQAEPTGKQPLQVESVAAVAENATTQQRVVETPPSDYRRGYWDGFNIGKREGRIEAEDAAKQAEPVAWVDVGLLEYRGNSVAFIHQKMTAYRAGIDAAWDALRAKGLHPDGKTPLADMIAKHTAPPQRKLVPLTEEEILKAIGWERAEMYMKLTPNFPVDEAKQETLKNARAVERAAWEKNHG